MASNSKNESFYEEEMMWKRAEIENQKLKTLLQDKKAEAMELSIKLMSLKWKIKKTDFVSYYEAKERDEEGQKIKKLTEQINTADEKWSGIEKQYCEAKKQVQILTQKRDAVNEEIKTYCQLNEKNESTFLELQRSVNILRNRNSAMMTKLKKQKKEYDDQIQNFTSKLNE